MKKKKRGNNEEDGRKRKSTKGTLKQFSETKEVNVFLIRDTEKRFISIIIRLAIN